MSTAVACSDERTGPEHDLARLLSGIRQDLRAEVYVFASVADHCPPARLSPFATVREDEGLIVVVTRAEADDAGLAYDFLAALITLRVNSALAAVGLSAAVSTALAEAGFRRTVIAGFHHDHLFVPHDGAEEALAACNLSAAPDAS